MKRTLLALTLALGALALPFDDDDDPKGPPPPEVGKAAPTFKLNDQDGKAVSVGGESDAWTVVAFYPMAATPG